MIRRQQRYIFGRCRDKAIANRNRPGRGKILRPVGFLLRDVCKQKKRSRLFNLDHPWSIPPRSRTFLHHCRSSIWNGCHDRPSEKSKFLLAIAKAMRITNQIITKSIFCYIPELLWRKSMLQCIISVAAPTH